jgi:hypothetical protein
MGQDREIDYSEEKWTSFINKVQSETKKLHLYGAGLPYYRGHYNSNWKLRPLIFRKKLTLPQIFELEKLLACDFHTLCGQLYTKELNDWEMSFEMRHGSLPTRLLDWTETFSNALFFAIYGKPSSDTNEECKPCIWILDPYKLNKKTYRENCIPDTLSLGFNYHNDDAKEWNVIRKKFKGPIAIIPPKSHGRMLAQQSLFTIHFNDVPIEKFYEPCVKKIDIPIECIKQAELFLFLAGVNEYSLFPDLDGLGKYLQKRFSYYIDFRQKT